jgi:ATP-dependent Lhr-like helicase
MHWEQLRPIQNAAITKIISSDDNFILVSRTIREKVQAYQSFQKLI